MAGLLHVKHAIRMRHDRFRLDYAEDQRLKNIIETTVVKGAKDYFLIVRSSFVHD